MIGLVRLACKQDAWRMAPKMSRADAAECWAVAHLKPLDALLASMDQSLISYVWEIDREPVCMYGIASNCLLGQRAQVWFLTSTLLGQHPTAFLRNYRAYLQNLLDYFPVLEQMVDSRHDLALRWLQWAGFIPGEPEPYGLDRIPFFPFILMRA